MSKYTNSHFWFLKFGALNYLISILSLMHSSLLSHSEYFYLAFFLQGICFEGLASAVASLYVVLNFSMWRCFWNVRSVVMKVFSRCCCLVAGKELEEDRSHQTFIKRSCDTRTSLKVWERSETILHTKVSWQRLFKVLDSSWQNLFWQHLGLGLQGRVVQRGGIQDSRWQIKLLKALGVSLFWHKG